MDIGALISGAAIALLSAWLASLYAEKKHRRELRAEFLELIGRQQALVHRSRIEDGDKLMTLTEKYTKWLHEENPNPATLAYVIGYVRQGNEQIESLMETIESARAEIDRLG